MWRNRSDGIPKAMRALLICWWAENTRLSPNCKEVGIKMIGPEEYDEKPTHYLTKSQVHWSFSFLQGL